MDFNAKNFRYTTMAFDDFARKVQDGARFYLRALSADAPADQPAKLANDFPLLAADFRLPEALNMCLENMHSSVLRVSGQVSLSTSCLYLLHDIAATASLVALCPRDQQQLRDPQPIPRTAPTDRVRLLTRRC
jgi:hypothetical protein